MAEFTMAPDGRVMIDKSALSDDPLLLGRPTGFKITVRDIKFSAGAGFLVPMTGKITTMPGLPPHPQSETMDLDKNGHIIGLS